MPTEKHHELVRTGQSDILEGTSNIGFSQTGWHLEETHMALGLALILTKKLAQ
ncbi:MAG: hypothetical protein J0J03_01915 [Leifsonia sp.]|nr:hypothetical protein [Leifsonia sp.]